MPPERHFDANYQEIAVLRDGTTVHLRLLRPTDKKLLREGFDRLSPDSRYRRFFSAKTHLTEDELRYLTELDGETHVAIGAARYDEDGAELGLGVARIVRLADRPDTAEFAVAVVDDAQGQGLGSLLFQRLMAAAKERGVRRLRLEILGSNRPMQEFIKDLSNHVDAQVQDGVVVAEFDVPGLEPDHPHHEPPRESPAYKMLKRAALELIHLERILPWLRRLREGR